MEKLTDDQKKSLVALALVENVISGADMPRCPDLAQLIKCGYIWTDTGDLNAFEPFDFMINPSGVKIVLDFVDPTGKSDLCKLLKATHG